MKKILLTLCLATMATLFVKAEKFTLNDSLDIYVGKYKFGEGSPVAEIEVVLENGKLALKSVMGNAGLEKAEGQDQFTIPNYNGTAAFFRNESKKISGVHIEAMGKIMDGEKQEPVKDDKKP